MLRALDEFVIEGPKTLLGFHKALLAHDCFVRGETCEGIVESEELAARAAELDGAGPANTLPGGRTVERSRTVEVDGRRFEVRVLEPEQPWRELARTRTERVRAGRAGGSDTIVSPMQGTVLSVAVAEGDAVESGQLICIVEAMKMENEVHTHRSGIVSELSVAAGRPVTTGQVICVIS
jgi:acetyl-CoA/propionyl-CoA/long-chain acyl-CoA carboxylase, biotin carboxylase, biotin carboxyl carrier protein